MKKIIKYFVLLLLVGGGGTAGYLYYTGFFNHEAGDEELAAAEEAAPQKLFLSLDPPFVVNFTHRGTLRYLQVSLELMYTQQEIIDHINEEMPAVRNALILLFSDQSYESLSSFEGKEELRHSILLAVNEVIGLEPEGEDQLPGEAYFTNFVMQ